MKLQQLRLEPVKALLEQAGCALPDAAQVGEAAYVQGVLDALCELSLRDPLSGLMNRRAFNSQLTSELDRVARSGETALLLMVDIDHFKRVNDTHGHLAGDGVIRAVGQALRDCVRPMDSVARFGGEEFALVLPNCQTAYAQQVAERIRARVEALVVDAPGGARLRVTVSCGGAFAMPWLRGTPADWVARADAQLYQAKAQGRNRVLMEAQPITEVSAEEKGLLFGLMPDDPGMMQASAQD